MSIYLNLSNYHPPVYTMFVLNYLQPDCLSDQPYLRYNNHLINGRFQPQNKPGRHFVFLKMLLLLPYNFLMFLHDKLSDSLKYFEEHRHLQFHHQNQRICEHQHQHQLIFRDTNLCSMQHQTLQDSL